jgi:putative FmdB family regulatory protein
MPIFIFKCKDCGEELELFIIPGANNQEPECTKCGSKNLEKIFSPFGMTGLGGCTPEGL